MNADHNIPSVAAHFSIDGKLINHSTLGFGHINDTFCLTFQSRNTLTRYTLQRINHNVFKDPESLMNNMIRVTKHIRNKLIASDSDQIDRRVMTLIPTRSGTFLYLDEDNNYWRIYSFINNAVTYNEPRSTDQAYQAARAFGLFQHYLCDLPNPQLHETIPDFHNTRKRFNALQSAIEKDTLNRAKNAKGIIDDVYKRADIIDTLMDLNRSGAVPTRVTHNDTKINNVLLDETTGEGICVLDLDTVMPGLSLYDFGDLIHSATSTAAEDEHDLARVNIDMTLFDAVTRGYLSGTGPLLNQTEKDHLVLSSKLLTLELGIRFLADYLEGDHYFKTHREGHNLDRCKVQLRKVHSIEEQEDEMNKIIRSISS